jgi:hypothetical protein
MITNRFRLLAALLLGASSAWAAATPMDAALTEDGVTTIECDVADKNDLTAFKYLEPDPPTKTEGYHYDLYLPKGYLQNKGFKYPCMFISDAGGNANFGAMGERLKRDEWIVAMLKESRNGSPDWLGNFLAAHDDVVKRVRIAKGAKFATGYSGGARCSSGQALVRPGFAGIVCQAAGFVYNTKPFDHYYEWYPPHVLVAGTFGDEDGNHIESHKMRRNLPLSRVNILLFKGGHSSAPAEVFGQSLDWMEQSLFLYPQQALQPRQPSKLGKVFPPELIDSEAYLWYFRKCRRQLDEVKEGPARYLALARILDVVNKGRLGADKDIGESVKKWQAELAEMKNTQPIRDFEGKALRAYQYALAAEDAYVQQMKLARASYFSGQEMRMSALDRQALANAIAACKAVVETCPDAVFTPECKLKLASLEIELSKAKK